MGSRSHDYRKDSSIRSEKSISVIWEIASGVRRFIG